MSINCYNAIINNRGIYERSLRTPRDFPKSRRNHECGNVSYAKRPSWVRYAALLGDRCAGVAEPRKRIDRFSRNGSYAERNRRKYYFDKERCQRYHAKKRVYRIAQDTRRNPSENAECRVARIMADFPPSPPFHGRTQLRMLLQGQLFCQGQRHINLMIPPLSVALHRPWSLPVQRRA